MNKFIRQFHRWTSIVFVATIIVTTVALAQPTPIVWVSYIPLIPLFLLLGSGLWMFVLPYAQRWRGQRAGN
jgi:predicted Na+-dependent transporter